MNLQISGRHMDIGTSFQTFIQDHFSTVVSRYFGRAVDGAAVFTKENSHIHAEVSVHPGRGLNIHAKANGSDPHQVFMDALDKLNIQMRRYKARLRDHHKQEKETFSHEATHYIVGDHHEEESTVPDTPPIVAEMSASIPFLTVSEAVMHMDLSNESALLFKNKATDVLNMVYRRKDGAIGWVDPTIS